MVTSDNSTLPREELALAVVEGENAIETLVGDKVIEDLPIDWRNAHLVKATLQDSLAMRSIDSDKYVHAPGTHFERLTAKFGDATLTVTPRGVELVVPWEMILDYSKRFDVLAFFSTRFGAQISGFTKEKLKADAVFNTSNLGSATNSSVAYTAANINVSGALGMSYIADTIAATRRLKARGEAPPYKQVMTGLVFERIRQSLNVQNYVRGALVGTMEVTLNAISLAMKEFGIDEIIVADSYINTAADSVTPSLTPIWSTGYIATFKPGRAGQTAATNGVGVPVISGIGVNPFWVGYDRLGQPSANMPDGETTFEMVGGNFVETYPAREIKAEVVRINMSDKPTILNARAGDLIATQYS